MKHALQLPESWFSSCRNGIAVSIVIKRPVHCVYQFYRDFTNLPLFLGDVMTVVNTGPDTSRWTVQGPLGMRAHWKVKVTAARRDRFIRYETVSPRWLTTRWEIRFATTSSAGETLVREMLNPVLGKFGTLALALVGKPPLQEVAANLRRMKQLLEHGQIYDMSYSVGGKFSPPSPPTERHNEDPLDPEIAAFRAALRDGWLFEDCDRR